MSRNFYSEIHLHVVWHTKVSLPLLTPEVETFAHRHIMQKAVNSPGVFCHEIGGTDNHVHVVLTVSPTVLVSDLVGQLKGAMHAVNHQFGATCKLLEWQSGYGVVSFGTKDLEWVRAYVRNQKEHHAKGKVFDRLERIMTEVSQAQAAQREAP